MKYLSLLLIGAMFGTAVGNASTGDTNLRTIEISSQFSDIESRVRAAAVRVLTGEGGHGSGSLVQYKDMQLVITAQHVASELIGTPYQIIHGTEVKTAVLVYSNQARDQAILWLNDPYDSGALRWQPGRSIAEVGDQITYSGFPASHSLMTFRGRVAGYETMGDGSTNILLHTYGYFGCSGSVIYDEHGYIVGILWGIDVNRGIPVESMVWVSPIQNLNIRLSLESICRALGNEPRACR